MVSVMLYPCILCVALLIYRSGQEDCPVNRGHLATLHLCYHLCELYF